MSLCDTLKSLATKLQISEREAIILYMSYNTLPKPALRFQANIFISAIAERFGLIDSPLQAGLGVQLVEKGILTLEEGKFFSTGHLSQEDTSEDVPTLRAWDREQGA